MNYNNKTIYKALCKIARKSKIDIIDKKILLSSLSMTACDLETYLNIVTPDHWKVDGAGVVSLELIKTALNAKEVSVFFDGEKYTATIDGKTSSGPCLFWKDFPEEKLEGFTFAGSVGASSVSSVLDFVGNDIFRPAMNGVYIGEHVVATNGHYMRYRNDDYAGKPFILRKEAADALVQFWGGFKTPETRFTVQLNSHGRVLLSNGRVEINSATINETYPNYSAVIPRDNAGELTIRLDDFKDAVKAVKSSCSKTVNAVELTCNHGALIVTGKDDDIGTRSDVTVRTIASELIPSGFRIGFNAKYLETVFSNVHCDDVTFKISEPNRAAVINGDILLMPVMLQSS